MVPQSKEGRVGSKSRQVAKDQTKGSASLGQLVKWGHRRTDGAG